jgi:hypothetical protein
MAARLSVAVHRPRMGQRDIIINEIDTADPAIPPRPPAPPAPANASDAVGVEERARSAQDACQDREANSSALTDKVGPSSLILDFFHI